MVQIGCSRIDDQEYRVALETDDAGSAGRPQVAVNPNGNAAIAVWQQEDDNGIYNIWSNRFE